MRTKVFRPSSDKNYGEAAYALTNRGGYGKIHVAMLPPLHSTRGGSRIKMRMNHHETCGICHQPVCSCPKKPQDDFKWLALKQAIDGLEHIYGFFLSPDTMTLVGDTMAALRVEQEDVERGLQKPDGK